MLLAAFVVVLAQVPMLIVSLSFATMVQVGFSLEWCHTSCIFFLCVLLTLLAGLSVREVLDVELSVGIGIASISSFIFLSVIVAHSMRDD